MEIEIPYKYHVRDYQEPFWYAMNVLGKKRACLIWHRRAGKDLTVWNFTIQQAFLEPGNYFYFFPSYAQGRKVIWDGKDKEGNTFLSYIPKEILASLPNNTMMQVRIQCANSDKTSLIQILGTDNYDSVMGTSCKGAVFSEYSLQDPKAWQYIRPILVESGGWAVFVYTPRGMNWGKELFDIASSNKDWFCEKLSVSDTLHDGKRIISEEAIQSERESGMSEDYVQQEFYVSFNMGIDGSYYGWHLEKAKAEGRITKVPWQPDLPVHTAIDIGRSDATSIVFYQLPGKEIHIIDHYENQGKDWSHYAKYLLEKPYVYGKHYAPHDIKAKTFNSKLSAQEKMEGMGIIMHDLPTLKISVESGIDTVRSLFPSFWIDEEKCSHLIKCLSNYQKVRDEKNLVYREQPLHNWASHSADSLRYACIAIKMYGNGSKGVDDLGYQSMLNKYLPKFN